MYNVFFKKRKIHVNYTLKVKERLLCSNFWNILSLSTTGNVKKVEMTVQNMVQAIRTMTIFWCSLDCICMVWRPTLSWWQMPSDINYQRKDQMPSMRLFVHHHTTRESFMVCFKAADKKEICNYFRALYYFSLEWWHSFWRQTFLILYYRVAHK